MVGTSSSVVPIAESPSAGVVIAGGSAAPVLSWSLPVETNAALTFDVEVASNEAMSGAEVFAGVTSAQVVLARLSAGPHFWRVRSKTATGEVSEFSDVERFTTVSATATEEIAAVPTSLVLETLYPNPVRERATVRFGLPEATRVRMVLYDALGREAAVLVDGERPAGMQHAEIDAATLAPGVYVVHLRTDRASQTRTLIIQH